MKVKTDYGPTLLAMMIGAYFFGMFVVDTGARIIAHLWGVLNV